MNFGYRKLFISGCGEKSVQTIPIKGIIFDMDGTLTVPVLNFKLLREKLGIPKNMDILEFANTAPTEEEKAHRHKLIEELEEDGNKKLTLQPSLHKLFYFLKESNIKRALLTRNNRRGVDSFLKKFIEDDQNSTFKEEKDIFSEVSDQNHILLCRTSNLSITLIGRWYKYWLSTINLEALVNGELVKLLYMHIMKIIPI